MFKGKSSVPKAMFHSPPPPPPFPESPLTSNTHELSTTNVIIMMPVPSNCLRHNCICPLLLLVVAATVTCVESSLATTRSGNIIFEASAPEIFYSPQNWFHNDTTASTVNSGAYMKINYTHDQLSSQGQTAPVLLIEPNDPTSDAQYMNIIYSIDDKEWVKIPVYENTSSIALLPPANEKTVPVWHTLEVQVYNSKQSNNRWSAPFGPNGAGLRVRGLSLAPGAKLAPRTDLQPKVRKKVLLICFHCCCFFLHIERERRSGCGLHLLFFFSGIVCAVFFGAGTRKGSCKMRITCVCVLI